MRRFIGTGLMMLCAALPAVAQETATDTGVTEAVEVNLVLLETLVLDGSGRTVVDLTESDMQLAVDGTATKIASLDLFCPLGPLDDVTEVKRGETRPTAPDVPRRIVLLVDYNHLSARDRTKVIDEITTIVRNDKAPDDEIMIAALTHDLRVEQRFTKDANELLETLERMDHDRTLFAADLGHVPGEQYLGALATLMDLLETHDGAKAVVMFSTAVARADVKVADFENVAQRAAAARTVIYPAYARWLDTPAPRHGREWREDSAGGARILTVLALGTGGRAPDLGTSDLSLAYARAQRDMACRYTVGFNVDASVAEHTHAIELVAGAGKQVTYPVRIRMWSEEERRESRLRAAFADPQRFDEPLVRAGIFPLRPAGKLWSSLVIVHFPLPLDERGQEVELRATLTRNGQRQGEPLQRAFTIPVDAAAYEHGDVPVTLLGDTQIKAGSYDFAVALSRPGQPDVVSTRFGFEVPSTPDRGAFVRGPVLARVVDKGVLIRVDPGEGDEKTMLDDVLTGDQSIEPLLVQEITPGDTLLAYWEACVPGKASQAWVQRQIVDEEGGIVHVLDQAVIGLVKTGKLGCGGKLDKIAANTLAPGDYRFEITVVDGDGGSPLASEATPLLVD